MRTLAKSPGFTLVAVLTLALGIGASTAVYTALERVLLDPLPYPDANRLVQLKSSVPKVGPELNGTFRKGRGSSSGAKPTPLTVSVLTAAAVQTWSVQTA